METAVSRIPVTMPVKKEDIAFHVFTKKSAIDWKKAQIADPFCPLWEDTYYVFLLVLLGCSRASILFCNIRIHTLRHGE